MLNNTNIPNPNLLINILRSSPTLTLQTLQTLPVPVLCAFVLLRCFSCSHTVLPKEHSLGVIFFSSLSSCHAVFFFNSTCISLLIILCMIVYVTNNKEPLLLTPDQQWLYINNCAWLLFNCWRVLNLLLCSSVQTWITRPSVWGWFITLFGVKGLLHLL